MNRQEVFMQLKGHEWILESFGANRVKIGRDGGILAFEFLADGGLTSESQMAFWPGAVGWDFDEKHQQINLLSADGKVSQSFKTPEEHDGVVVLYEVNGTDQFKYFISADIVRNLSEAPQPLQMKFSQQLSRQQTNLIIQLGGNQKSDFAQSATSVGLNFEIIDLKLHDVQGWKKLYRLLIERPAFSKIMIATEDYQIINYPFEEVSPKRIYLDDELEFMDLSDGKAQKLKSDLLIGDRETVLELVALFANQEQFSNSIFNELVYRYFADRIVHGRLVSQKPKIKSQKSWVTQR